MDPLNNKKKELIKKIVIGVGAGLAIAAVLFFIMKGAKGEKAAAKIEPIVGTEPVTTAASKAAGAMTKTIDVAMEKIPTTLKELSEFAKKEAANIRTVAKTVTYQAMAYNFLTGFFESKDARTKREKQEATESIENYTTTVQNSRLIKHYLLPNVVEKTSARKDAKKAEIISKINTKLAELVSKVDAIILENKTPEKVAKNTHALYVLKTHSFIINNTPAVLTQIANNCSEAELNNIVKKLDAALAIGTTIDIGTIEGERSLKEISDAFSVYMKSVTAPLGLGLSNSAKEKVVADLSRLYNELETIKASSDERNVVVESINIAINTAMVIEMLDVVATIVGAYPELLEQVNASISSVEKCFEKIDEVYATTSKESKAKSLVLRASNIAPQGKLLNSYLKRMISFIADAEYSTMKTDVSGVFSYKFYSYDLVYSNDSTAEKETGKIMSSVAHALKVYDKLVSFLISNPPKSAAAAPVAAPAAAAPAASNPPVTGKGVV